MVRLRSIVAALYGLMAVAAGPATAADDTAALEALRSEVVHLLARERPALKPTRGSEPWFVEVTSGTLSLLNLARTLEGLEGSKRREEILRFVDRALPSAAPDGKSSFASVAKRLRVQIAPAEYGAANSPIRALGHPFSDGLMVAYVVDYPDHVEYVRDDHPGIWKVERETIEKAAVANLDRALKRASIEVETVKTGLGRHVIVSDNDGYGAARILCPEYMARLHAELGPHLFIGIPARDFLVVWTPGHGSRTKLVSLVEDLHRTRSHPLTRTVFVTDGGRLRPASSAEIGD